MATRVVDRMVYAELIEIAKLYADQTAHLQDVTEIWEIIERAEEQK